MKDLKNKYLEKRFKKNVDNGRLTERVCGFCKLSAYYNEKQTRARFQCYRCLSFNKIKKGRK